MKFLAFLFLIVALGGNRLAAQSGAQTGTKTAPTSQTENADPDPAPTWPFPVASLDEHLPEWLHIGGEYRTRIEGPTGIGYAPTQDFYLLSRLRINAAIQASSWLSFHGEVQDPQIFFNHHIPNANPYEDKWTLWEAYPQVGSSESGWVDALAGREVFRFGTIERQSVPSILVYGVESDRKNMIFRSCLRRLR